MFKIEYQGFWIRFAAHLIDSIIISFPSFIIGFIVGFMGYFIGMDEITLSILSHLIGLIAGLLYFAFMESSKYQGTLGKIALGIKVVDENGEKITMGRAIGRYFAKIISGITLLIGYIMAGFTPKKQALHDMIASTYVVKK